MSENGRRHWPLLLPRVLLVTVYARKLGQRAYGDCPVLLPRHATGTLGFQMRATVPGFPWVLGMGTQVFTTAQVPYSLGHPPSPSVSDLLGQFVKSFSKEGIDGNVLNVRRAAMENLTANYMVRA